MGVLEIQEHAGSVVTNLEQEHKVSLMGDIHSSLLTECASKGHAAQDISWANSTGTGTLIDGKISCRKSSTSTHTYALVSY